MSSINYVLDEYEIEEYKEAYGFFDQDGDGYIAQKELGTLMRSLGHNPMQEQLGELSELIDDEGKRISFPKFLEIMTIYIDKRRDDDMMSEEDLLKSFKDFNPNSEGLVSMNSIRKYFQELGNSLVSPKDPSEFYQNKNWDDGKDEYIDFEAFKKMFTFAS